ncbi:MAG TPA: branched-chain amino acid ABC transporter permease [Clostridia bacterium]|nr:branched-chain amino acid ABC transporter permease [Clostridia bacterium]
MTTILQLVMYGLQLGSIYALIALGYTMVYGIIGLINFAHGDFLMVGAFIVFFLAKAMGGGTLSYAVVAMIIIAGMILTGLLGVATERIAYKPLRKKPRLSALITAIGVSMFLENFPRALPFIGPAPRPFPSLFPLNNYNILGVGTNSVQILMITFSILLMIGLHYITTKTKVGNQMRAVQFDKDAAALMGINVNNTISVTFFIGAALAAAGGVFYASIYPMIDVYMGIWLGTKAFVAAVLGGIGDIRGAMLGGFIMGIAEVLATAVNSDLGYGAGFVILILILLFKPAGIMGKFTIEKV